ncbi:MAG: AMP-binding protein, partial [Lachnospiraceae bacterium]|nr:AMP-binding protein [Lachnospiraceae bacterium]
LEKIIDTDLAYVLFTSGSTGVPKGVAIAQRSIIDYIDWAKEEFSIDEDVIIGNQAPFYFDNSILDIYLCMSTGAHLHIIPPTYYAFPAKLLQYIADQKINFIFWVPSALITVANSGLLERIDCTCLKKILFAGEVMSNKYLNYWRKNIPADIYANLYGPTELTDVCAYYVVNREFHDDDPLPIGNACRNTQIILLDEEDKVISTQDKMGELCVRGTGVSVGYYANAEKTKQAFVQNPLHNNYCELIYRTGDLAHYNEYGEIMFDGRKDYQIKHLGYRIELGEIETALISIEGIKNVCCVYDDIHSEIVALYETANDLSESDIRKKLVDILPKYMIPTRYYLMEKLPLNDNGKINRKELKKYVMEEK